MEGISTSEEFILSGAFTDHSGTVDEERAATKKQIQTAATRTWMITLLLVALGAAASGAFLYLGITGAQEDQKKSFERRASDLSKEIVSSFRDYETAALWIHEACRDWREGDFTRADFSDLYNYIVSGGLDFFLAEFVPNVTQDERPALEAEATAYYASDANVSYNGFKGIQANPDDPDEIGLFPRSDQPFYFPIHLLEPYERIGDAVHLDLYSIPYEQHAINEAIRNFEPVLTERFVIVSQDTDGFSVSLVHPGVPLPGDSYVRPRDLALLLIHIRALLDRAARFQGVSLAAYLYDATNFLLDDTQKQDFLGGANIEVSGDDNSGKIDVTYFNETELEAVQKAADLYYEHKLEVGSRTWTIAVVPVEGDESFQPDIAFVILGGVMIFGASLLLAWIWIMHNRRHTQQVTQIVDKAAAESKIVANLYPAAVREHMIQEQNADKEKEAAPTAKQSFMNHNGGEFNMFTADQGNGEKLSNGMYKTKPIADRYDATTIMFADLAGFTAWSSTRSPEDVFTLLETLYGAFDSIAKKRRVFKVETIGDCYVAVAGLPKPRSDHAIVMCRFANDCLHKMQKLTKVLAEGSLGSDTNNLCFRVGLHSGPVTAGVLRGDKGRFQLFGDTMNTASRMESTGVKNKIQVSKETADLLIVGGYLKWLTPREDMVHAKGKGTIQTYFVKIASGSTVSSEAADTMTTANPPFGHDALPTAPAPAPAKRETFEEEYTEVVYV